MKANHRWREYRVLYEGFEVIVRNIETIRNDIVLGSATSEILHILFLNSDRGCLPLGALADLWNRKVLIVECDRCSEKVYIFRIFGNPYRGHHSWTGFCLNCKKFKEGAFVSSGKWNSSKGLIAQNYSKWRRWRYMTFAWNSAIDPALREKLEITKQSRSDYKIDPQTGSKYIQRARTGFGDYIDVLLEVSQTRKDWLEKIEDLGSRPGQMSLKTAIDSLSA